MKRRGVALSWAVAASAILASAIVTSSDARAEPRAVIELFTSQGCSSCPAADKLAGELALDPSLVVLSLPIDYWDYLGWKDTLAIPGHTKRQKAYSKVRGDREVYTPQVVVNGVAHALGNDKSAIESAIKHSRKHDVLGLPVSLSVSGDQINVSVPATKSGVAKGEVWLCPITSNAEVTIERGENKGNSVTYHNVVRRWVKLGEYTGAARTFTVPKEDVTNVGGDAVAVVVQSGSKEVPSEMLGAAVVALK